MPDGVLLWTYEYGTRDTVVRKTSPVHEILTLADYGTRHGERTYTPV